MKLTSTLQAATVLGLGLAAAPVWAANTFTVASIQGGSSAFLGNFAPASFSEGALPQVIGGIPNAITNYKASRDVDEAIVAANVTLTDGTITETASQAEIRFNAFGNAGTPENGSDYRLIVLLRTDSGFGVRYVTNKFYIKSWSTFSTTSGSPITPNGSGSVPEQVANYLVKHTGRTYGSISAGLSDVSADTIARYANFPNISSSGLKSLTGQRVGVLTLLPLYNGGTATRQINFGRGNIQGLIAGTSQPFGLTNVFYREQSSGTRNTEIVDVQALYPPQNTSTPSPTHLSYTAESGGTLVTSTGSMLTGIDSTANSFGYAFVTGTAGNGKTNVLIGAYNGINPINGKSTSGGYVPLPAYNTGTPFRGVTNGAYTLWSYEQLYQNVARPDATANSLVNILNNTSNQSIVHSQGLLQVSELNTAGYDRDAFISDLVGSTVNGSFVGETVYDGQAVGTSATRTVYATFHGNPQP